MKKLYLKRRLPVLPTPCLLTSLSLWAKFSCISSGDNNIYTVVKHIPLHISAPVSTIHVCNCVTDKEGGVISQYLLTLLPSLPWMGPGGVGAGLYWLYHAVCWPILSASILGSELRESLSSSQLTEQQHNPRLPRLILTVIAEAVTCLPRRSVGEAQAAESRRGFREVVSEEVIVKTEEKGEKGRKAGMEPKGRTGYPGRPMRHHSARFRVMGSRMPRLHC